MNKRKLLAGAVAGITTLGVGIPAFAQVTGTGTSDSAALKSFTIFSKKVNLTQEAVKEMADRDTEFLENIDTFVAIQKKAVQAHRDALNSAATIGDDAARQEAVEAAHEAMRKTIQEAIAANPDLQAGMMMGGRVFSGQVLHHGPHPGILAEKFGMTPEELKTVLESGKTLQEIAKEKGVELPEKVMLFRGGPLKLADELGMTEVELKAAFESGKSLEELAEERGIDLPERPMFFRHDIELNASSPTE